MEKNEKKIHQALGSRKWNYIQKIADDSMLTTSPEILLLLRNQLVFFLLNDDYCLDDYHLWIRFHLQAVQLFSFETFEIP